MRIDQYLHNEAASFVITSKNLSQRVSIGLDEVDAGIEAGIVLPVELVEDGSFGIRVIVNAPLSKQENEEWMHQANGKLNIADGVLTIAAGNEYLAAPQSKALQDSGAVLNVRLSAGVYAVTLLTYINSVNAIYALVDSAQIGKWFRQTRPHRDFPAWLKVLCSEEPTQDPGHETFWEQYDAQKESNEKFISFILHLNYLGTDADAQNTPGAWLPRLTPSTMRLPAKCPLGLPFKEPANRQAKPTKSRERPESYPLMSLNNESLSLAITTLTVPYWLSWFAQRPSQIHFKLDLPSRNCFSPNWSSVPHLKVAMAYQGYLFALQGEGEPYFDSLRALGKLLLSAPDNSMLEMTLVYQPTHHELLTDAPHFQRLVGKIVAGTWMLTGIFPPTEPEILSQAFELARKLEEEETIVALNTKELAGILKNCIDDSRLTEALATDGLKIKILPTKEKQEIARLGSLVFKLRYGDTWPALTMLSID